MSKPIDVDTFAKKFEPAIAAQLHTARKHLAKLFPRGYELVYDNYNALACGISSTDRASNVVVSVAAYPKWITLFFFNGAKLPDPHRVLQGTGSRIRSIRLDPMSILTSRPVQDLLAIVVEQSEFSFADAPRLTTIVKSISAKQRPRRPAAQAKPKRIKKKATKKSTRSKR